MSPRERLLERLRNETARTVLDTPRPGPDPQNSGGFK